MMFALRFNGAQMAVGGGWQTVIHDTDERRFGPRNGPNESASERKNSWMLLLLFVNA